MGARGADGRGAAPHTGTTIVAVAFQGGVVLGADSRVRPPPAPALRGRGLGGRSSRAFSLP